MNWRLADRRTWRWPGLLLVIGSLQGVCEAPAAAQTTGPPPGPASDPAEQRAATRPAATQPAATQPAAAAEPRAGPKYAPLRYDDDFSYLDGPEGSYAPDLFDPIKRIHLGDDLTVRLGGEIRGRLEALTHKNYGRNQGRFAGATPTQDTYFLHRYYYHADFNYRDFLRVYVEGISAWGEDRDQFTPVAPYQNRFDAHQLFLDLRPLGPATPLTVRFGRQELQYGKQRLISALDWANVRRTWDAVKIFWSDENWNIDAFYARPVETRNRRPDAYDEDQDFYGLYTTYKGLKNHGLDVYFLALDNTGVYTNANLTTGDVGDLSLYTMGTRFFGKTALGPGTWDYDTEVAGQWGKAAGDTVQAWMWSAETGYAFDIPMKPRIGIGIDYASGDDDAYDDIHGTFNQLFPFGHFYLGYLDQVGRQNIWAQNVNLTFVPLRNVTAQLAFHSFWLAERVDALYNAAGAAVRRSPHGDVGAFVGNELDLTLVWDLDVHTSLLLGYSHMWASRHFFTRRNGDSEDPDLLYVQYRYRF